MPYTEPTKLPEWASVLANDPVSGQPNVAEPAETKKDSGFNFRERPPRQDVNWLFNVIYKWTQWFQQQVNSTWNNLNTYFSNLSKTNTMVSSATALRDVTHQFYLVRDFINGLRLLNVVNSAPNFSVRVGKGKATIDSFNPLVLDLNYIGMHNGTPGGTAWPSTGIEKRINGAGFVKGNNACGRPSSVTLSNNTWYHVFVVYYNDNDSLDIGFDDNVDGANLLAEGAEFAYARRIFSVFYQDGTDGIRVMKQIGNYFVPLFAPIIKATGQINNSAPNIDVDVGALCPPDVDVVAQFLVTGLFKNWNGITSGFPILSKWQGAGVAVPSLANGASMADNAQSTHLHLLIDGSDRKVSCEAGAVGATTTVDVEIYLLGYHDLRGGDWGQGVNGTDSWASTFKVRVTTG